MSKTRVPKGEKYFYINEVGHISNWKDTGGQFSLIHLLSGNYFHTQEEAEQMARKLRAVLQGADVIEMPSEEEIITESIEKIPCWCKDGDPHQGVDCDICFTPEKRKYFIEGVNWLKDKIVK